MKNRSQFSISGALLSLAILLAAALTVGKCAELFRGGAVTREAAGEAFRQIGWAFWVLAGCLVFALTRRITPGAEKKEAPVGAPAGNPAGVRLALYLIAGVLVALGIGNGGARDVLYKAINICTECIGLG